MHSKLIYCVHIFIFCYFIGQIEASVSCISSYKGSTEVVCFGASFCTSVWTKSGSNWSLSKQYCTKTTMPHSPYSSWTVSGSSATLTCATNYCNSKNNGPPNNSPTPTPIPVPGVTTCLMSSPPNSTCSGNGCMVIKSAGIQNIIIQGCPPSTLATELVGLNQMKYCTKITAGTWNHNALYSTTCLCDTGANCNNNALLSWGNNAFMNTSKIMCQVGSANITNGIQAQYCAWSQTMSNATTYRTQSYGVTSTLPMPRMGCKVQYGGDYRLFTASCTCNTSNCNGNGTVPLPTAFPSLPPTTPSPTVQPTSTLYPTNQPNITRFPTGTTIQPPTTQPVNPNNALMILLEYFDNRAGGGRLYSGAHCDKFWFTGMDNCDMTMSVCIEPLTASPVFQSCSNPTGWIIMPNNTNYVTFKPGVRYNSWFNPMSFDGTTYQQTNGFRVKYFVQELDSGGRQLIDQYSCDVNNINQTPRGPVLCQHVRPGGFPASLKLSYVTVFPGSSPDFQLPEEKNNLDFLSELKKTSDIQ